MGVTPEMTQIAAATPEPVTQENLLQMPMSPMERMMEEDGKAKTIGKMRYAWLYRNDALHVPRDGWREAEVRARA